MRRGEETVEDRYSQRRSNMHAIVQCGRWVNHSGTSSGAGVVGQSIISGTKRRSIWTDGWDGMGAMGARCSACETRRCSSSEPGGLHVAVLGGKRRRGISVVRCVRGSGAPTRVIIGLRAELPTAHMVVAAVVLKVCLRLRLRA